MLTSIPSPSSDTVPVLGIRYYGLMIMLGVIAAVLISRRRWKAAGHDPDEIADISVWAVPAGLLGARLYHVVTDFNLHKGQPWYWPFQIWNGGLGIPGGILFGILGGVYAARRYKIDIPSCADAMVPTIPLAQAIGRLGNYFNQELFGRHSTLPWALEIDPLHRCPDGGIDCANAMLADERYFALVIPWGRSQPGGLLADLAEVARAHGKPVCIVSMSQGPDGPGVRAAEMNPGLVVFRSLDACFDALAQWFAFG